jgi:hypothetical protein
LKPTRRFPAYSALSQHDLADMRDIVTIEPHALAVSASLDDDR